MAGKKDRTTMWILVLAGGAGLWWYMSQKSAAAAAPTALPAPVTSVIPPVTTTATTLQTPAPLTAPAPAALSAGSTLSPSGVPYDNRMDTLQTWAQNSLNACDLTRWNNSKGAFTQDEWNGLYDIYFNDWMGGQGTTAARTSFWNAWRVKYSIMTNTPC